MSNYSITPIPVQVGRGRRIRDLTGRTFGRLAVVGFSKLDKAAYWLCRCECGEIVEVIATDLNTSSKRSCGCLIRDSVRERMTTHGQSYGPEYRAWASMKRRCYTPSCKYYENYGGRGITVCARWLDSFENFFADMGLRPSKKHSLDRIDNDGNYEPGNCRWSTSKEQTHNRRTSCYLTSRGVTKVEAEWSRILGSNANIVQKRINLGWCVDCAVSLKPKSGKCPHRNKGEKQCLTG